MKKKGWCKDMGFPIIPALQIVGAGVVNYFIRKAAKAKSQEFIDKVLDTILEYAGPAVISALRRKAEGTVNKVDDVLVNGLEDILDMKE